MSQSCADLIANEGMLSACNHTLAFPQNWNDGFMGGDLVEGNVIFNMVRE
eukprot:COSAG01_NODE_4318_length_5137_cov_14.668718_3_plen_50_part_00